MKRSAAIKLFIEVVRDNCYDEGFELTEDEASVMLDQLQKLGVILPPELPSSRISYDWLQREHGWEPENG